ncbi:MAG: AAA family ATPase [Methanobrevibacter sp.]|nr:AAA family ATPase [Methanobrevibacter sp.]
MINLVFSKIKLHNFFSFSDAELSLSDMGFTLVEGRNYCKLDNAYSNGSGKSSIFNGICFALTGETAQGISTGIENIFSDPDDCWVELTFMADGNEFILRRYKTPKPDLKV